MHPNGIPAVSYLGDFGALAPARVGKPSFRTSAQFGSILGIELNDSKSDVGRLITFSGIVRTFPFPANGMHPSSEITPGKATRRIDAIRNFTQRGRVGHKDLVSLVGKHCFSTNMPVRGICSASVTSPLSYAQPYMARAQIVGGRASRFPSVDIGFAHCITTDRRSAGHVSGSPNLHGRRDQLAPGHTARFLGRGAWFSPYN